MDRKRIALLVYVDLDIMPGVMHTEESAQTTVQSILDDRIPHYNPNVYVADEKALIK